MAQSWSRGHDCSRSAAEWARVLAVLGLEFPDVRLTTLGRIVAIGVMLVGIGFLTLLIGAASERFVRGDVEEEIAQAEREIEDDVDAARAEVVAELRAIGERLRQLEGRL
jgi:hypothetical protein